MEFYPEYLDLAYAGGDEHLPPGYKRNENGPAANARDMKPRIISQGPLSTNLGDFSNTTEIEHFALVKPFTFYKMLEELVTKDDPFYFKPPGLSEQLNQFNKRDAADDENANTPNKRTKSTLYRLHEQSMQTHLESLGEDEREEFIGEFKSLIDSKKIKISALTEDDLKEAPHFKKFMLDRKQIKETEEQEGE